MLEKKYDIEQLFDAFEMGYNQSLNHELVKITGTDELPMLFARLLKKKQYDKSNRNKEMGGFQGNLPIC